MNIIKIQQYSQLIAQLPYYGGQYRIKKGGMMMNLQRIFIKDDILFFVFRLGNYSNISYDIQLTRFYVKDRKQKKRSSQMEEEIIPLYQYMITDQKVKSKEKASFVVAFNKFTISDHKHLMVEILEKNGDRGLQLRLTGNAVLRAIPF